MAASYCLLGKCLFYRKTWFSKASFPTPPMTVDQLRIFISYTHDDQKMASELEGLFNGALGPAVHVFRDETSIGYGGDIRESILEELEKADVLIALIAGGHPASVLSWVGWEIGTFEAAWRRREESKDPRVDLSEESLIGRVVVLCDAETSLGPQSGRKTVKLGIPSIMMSEPPTNEEWQRFRGEARGHTELQDLVRKMEKLVEDGRHQQWIQDRQKGIDILVVDFKEDAFKALRGRVRHVSKPTKQLLVRFGVAIHQDEDTNLPGEARLIFSGLASAVFGLQQDDPRLFRKVEEPPIGFERYEATWGAFKEALKNHRSGAYWLDIIEQAVLGAKKGGAALDANLVLVADNKQRHRVVATTVTTFFNNDCEVSLYLIEALQRSRPHFAAPSFAIHIKADQLAILQDGRIPPEAELSGEGGWEAIFGKPIPTENCKWRDIVKGLDSPEPWIYPLATLMWHAYELQRSQYPSVGVRIKFTNDNINEYRVFRLCLQQVDVTGDAADFSFAAAAVVVPYEPAANPAETRLYHLYNLAWFFRRRLLERELTRLDFELLNRSPNELALKTIIAEISNDFRTLIADAQVRGMEKEAAVIESVNSPLRGEVRTRLFEEWPRLYDELLTHLKAGVPAAKQISETLHNMKPVNGFFLKTSIEELNRYIDDK
jgi:hypothetical protein